MMPSLRPSRRHVLRGYLVLPHAVPILVVMTATAAFAVVAAGGRPGLGSLVCLLGAMFGGQIAVGAVNELVDADLDAVAKPNKPIPAGLVSRRGARTVAIVGLILMALFSLRFSVEAFALCALGTSVGLAYSVWFKRTIWSWVPYLIALPLLPIWVWTALSTVKPGLFAIYPIGAVAVVAVQIAQSLPDAETDKAARVETLAVALGPKRAQQVCWGAMILAALLAAGLASWLTEHPVHVWFAAPLACALVGLNIIIWGRNARAGVMACFPCMALSAVVLGVSWTMALFSL